MTNRNKAPTTGYLWSAHRSEPGMRGSARKITRAPVAPDGIEPVQAMPGLVYAESRYGDWHLLGEVTLPLIDYTEMGEPMVGVSIDHSVISADDLAESHRYRHARG